MRLRLDDRSGMNREIHVPLREGVGCDSPALLDHLSGLLDFAFGSPCLVAHCKIALGFLSFNL